MATFAALGHFLLFLLTWLGGSCINGIYRFNNDFGARLTGRTRFTGRTWCTFLARFARLALLTGFTFHALFATSFTLLTRLALFAGTAIAVFTGFAVATFTLLASFRIVAVATIVITTRTLTTATAFFALVTLTFILACFTSCWFLGGSFHVGRGCIAAEQAGNAFDQLAEEADFGRGRSNGSRRLLRCNRGRLCRLGKALQQRLLTLDHLSLLRLVDRLGNLGFQLVAGRFRDLVLTNASHFVVRGFQMLVRNDVNTHIIALLQTGDGGTLLVKQIGGNIHRHLAVNLLGVVLHGLFFDETQDGQGEGFVVTDHALTLATGADMAAGLVEGGAQTLARHLQQTETGDPAQLDAGTILMHRFTQTVFHFALMANRGHVDEVDYDQATQVAQTQLTGNFVGRFQVGLQRSLFDIAALGGAGGVDIDGGQCFGRIDNDAAAGGEAHFTLES